MPLVSPTRICSYSGSCKVHRPLISKSISPPNDLVALGASPLLNNKLAHCKFIEHTVAPLQIYGKESCKVKVYCTKNLPYDI